MNKYTKKSIIYTALSLPSGVTLGYLVAVVLKSANPSDVDVTNGLAYLTPVLVTGMVTIIVMLGAAFRNTQIGLKVNNDDTSRFANKLFLVTLTILIIHFVLNAIHASIID